MTQIEDYFIDEEKIKQRISGNRQVANQITLDSDTNHQTSPELSDKQTPSEIKEDSIEIHSENKGKPSLDSLFESSTCNVGMSSRIYISSGIAFRLKQVALYMEQRGMPHSLNKYISNVLLRHLNEYEEEINKLKDKQL